MELNNWSDKKKEAMEAVKKKNFSPTRESHGFSEKFLGKKKGYTFIYDEV